LLHYKCHQNVYSDDFASSSIDDVPLNHPFFLMPKIKGFNVTKHVWFMKTPMGRNTFGKLSKQLIDYIPTLKGKQITNKTWEGIAISRTVEALVLVEYGMKISSHHDARSCAK
jgi:hypothetical protein